MVSVRSSPFHAVTDQDGAPAGTLSIGANEGPFLYVLPNVFAKYHRKFPKVRFSVYRSFTHKVIEKVEEGAVDLGVVTTPVKSPSLEVVPVFRDRIFLMVGQGSPLFTRKSVTLEEFAQQPLIVPKTGSIRRLIEKNLRPFREDLNITMELTSVGMFKRFVASGLVVVLICACFAASPLHTREARPRTSEGLGLGRGVGPVYLHNPPPT